jgi:hypothetical protein
MEKIKNYGLNIELERQQMSEEDWQFGALSPVCIACIPESEREKYLPLGEVQRGREDMMDCATRGPINILETKFNWLYRNEKLTYENLAWLKSNGYVNTQGNIEFSDAFIAIKSGTTRQGNSLKAPLHAIHEYGLVPKNLLPLNQSMTFDQYHDPKRITESIENLGREFIKRFTVNYEQVRDIHMDELLKDDFLDVAGYAWPNPAMGEYPKSDQPINHCFILHRHPKYYAFDNYIDPVDGDFIKKLASDYDFWDYGYRIIVSENEIVYVKTALELIVDFVNLIIKKLLK